MDFAIAMQEGQAAMTFEPASNIFNNVYLSLTIKQGAFFAAPGFGNRFHLLKKNSARTEALVEEYGKEALKWLLDTGRAESVKVYAQRDTLRDTTRINLLVEVVQVNGQLVRFEHFVEVV